MSVEVYATTAKSGQWEREWIATLETEPEADAFISDHAGSADARVAYYKSLTQEGRA